MVCHCSLLANDSSIRLKKKWTSSGNRRPCTKLWATRPSSLCAYVLTLANTSSGSLPSLKVVCQPTLGREEDAILVPTWVASREPPVGSQIVIPQDTRVGVLEGASLETLGGCSAIRCLFLVQPAGGGGVWSLPWGCCGWTAGRVSGENRLMFIVHLVTISSPWSASASEELTDLTATSSAI